MAHAVQACKGGRLLVASNHSEQKSVYHQIQAPHQFSSAFLPSLNLATISGKQTSSSRELSACQYQSLRNPSASLAFESIPTMLGASASTSTIILGVDFGGTGIKAAPVDISTGKLVKERVRIPTPSPATPQAVAQVVKQLQRYFQWQGPIGVGMPSVVKQGRVHSAANIDKSWIDIDAADLFRSVTGCHVAVLNDADAAGYAELAFGAAQELRQSGVVLMTTFGTGIGTAIFVDGNLVPNLELGHVEVNGVEAERWASDRVREKEELSWKKWAQRVNDVLATYDRLLQPELIFLHLLSVESGTKIVAAQMRNDAGIVGAAVGGFSLLQRELRAHPPPSDAQAHTYLHHERVVHFQQAAETDGGDAVGALGAEVLEASSR